MVSTKSRSKSFAVWSLVSMLAYITAGTLALMFNKIPFEKIDVESESIIVNINFIQTNYPNLLNTWRLPFLLFGMIALVFTVINFFITIEPKRA